MGAGCCSAAPVDEAAKPLKEEPADGAPAAAAPAADGAAAPVPKQDKRKCRQLQDGVDLYTKSDPENFSITYSIYNGKMATLVFTLDASESSNMACDAWEEKTKKTVEVPPDEEVEIGTLVPVDPAEAKSLKLGFSWLFQKMDKEGMKAADADNVSSMEVLAEQMRNSNIIASELGTAAAVEEALKNAGLEHFIDVEFMPSDAALYNDPENEDAPPIVWRRPVDFLAEGLGAGCVYADGIKPCDIRQGALGDCWYLASLAALAEFPEMIKRRFVTKGVQESGVYEMQCFKNGKLTTVIVDDYFPCNPQTGKPCYSRAKGGELWPLLLEKAWAKLHGSYEQIEGGVPMHAIMDLCGGIGKVFMFQHEQEKIESGEFWDMLVAADEQKYLMVAGSPGHDNMTKSADDRPAGGIVPGHAYTLKGAKEANGVKLVNLRNPWGQFEWEGDWCDESPLWTDEMKAAFNPKLGGDDGEFWMSASDFFTYFSDLSLVYFRGHVGEEWSVSRTEVVTPAAAFTEELFQFDIDAEATGIIGLIQRDKRIRGTPDYTELAFAVFGPVGDNGMPARELIRSNNWASRELVERITPDMKLEPGRYVVAVYNPNRIPDVPAVLVVELFGLAHDDVPTELIPLTEEERRELVLCTAVHSTTSDLTEYEAFDISGTWMPHGGYAVAAKNKGADAMNMTFDFSNCAGLQMYGSEEMSLEIVLEAKEGMQLIAEFIPIDDARSFGYSVSYSVSG